MLHETAKHMFPMLQELTLVIQMIPEQELSPTPEFLSQLKTATDQVETGIQLALDRQVINSATAAIYNNAILSVRAFLAQHGYSEVTA